MNEICHIPEDNKQLICILNYLKICSVQKCRIFGKLNFLTTF